MQCKTDFYCTVCLEAYYCWSVCQPVQQCPVNSLFVYMSLWWGGAHISTVSCCLTSHVSKRSTSHDLSKTFLLASILWLVPWWRACMAHAVYLEIVCEQLPEFRPAVNHVVCHNSLFIQQLNRWIVASKRVILIMSQDNTYELAPWKWKCIWLDLKTLISPCFCHSLVWPQVPNSTKHNLLFLYCIIALSH